MTHPNWRSPRWLVTPCSAGTALWLAGACSAAVVTSWTAPRGGLFSNPANWSAGVPGLADTGAFDLPVSHAVDLTGSATASRMLVRYGQVALNLGGNALDLPNGVAFTPGLVVGNLAGDGGALVLAEGTVAASLASVGIEPASSGSLDVGAWGMQLGSLASSIGTATIVGADLGILLAYWSAP